MWQVLLFDCENPAELDQVLQGLSSFATCRAESGFYWFSQRPGEPEFQFDCELISGRRCPGYAVRVRLCS